MVCVTTELAREASRRHKAAPVASAVLGYGMTGGALLGALLKAQQRVALKVEANGPLRKVVVEADAYGRVRGYVAEPDVQWPLPIGPDAVADALGHLGVLTVVKDLRLKDLFTGVVPLESGALDKELAHYLNRSEQVPSLVEMGIHLDGLGRLAAAGGMLFQLLPNAERRALADLAERLEDLPPLETLLVDGHGPADILASAFGSTDYVILEQQPLLFRCTCSRERSRQALLTLGRQDIEELIAEGEAVVDCHFCHERYVFAPEELAAILRAL
jgi:molecular chaperone Hsp33